MSTGSRLAQTSSWVQRRLRLRSFLIDNNAGSRLGSPPSGKSLRASKSGTAEYQQTCSCRTLGLWNLPGSGGKKQHVVGGNDTRCCRSQLHHKGCQQSRVGEVHFSNPLRTHAWRRETCSGLRTIHTIVDHITLVCG